MIDASFIKAVEELARKAGQPVLLHENKYGKTCWHNGETVKCETHAVHHRRFTTLESFWRYYESMIGTSDIYASVNESEIVLGDINNTVFTAPLTDAYKYLRKPYPMSQKDMIRFLRYKLCDVPEYVIQALRQYKVSATTETEAVQEKTTNTLGKKTMLSVKMGESDLSFNAAFGLYVGSENVYSMQFEIDVDLEKHQFTLEFSQDVLAQAVVHLLNKTNINGIENFYLGTVRQEYV